MNTEKYLKLRDEVDGLTEQLWSEHKSNMACKKGCDMCCLNFDVFPIEFDHIKKQVQEEYPDVLDQELPETVGEKCFFLKDGSCTIYDARPIICRTHGYPLLYMNETGDQWQLSHCELNFLKVDEEYFNEDNCYPQDTFNSRLFMMNKEYISSKYPNKNEFDLISLVNLLK